MPLTAQRAQCALRRPPPTAMTPVTDEYHGVRVADSYRWLEDPDARARSTSRSRWEIHRGYCSIRICSLPTGRWRSGSRCRAPMDACCSTAPRPAGRTGWSFGSATRRPPGIYPNHLRWIKFSDGAWTKDGTGFFYGRYPEPKPGEGLVGHSPLHNLKPGTDYPVTLITTADHDDRVVPAHSFKFAAALQAATAWKRPAYIRIETKAGHGAGKPISKIIEEQADIYAFAFANLAPPSAIP